MVTTFTPTDVEDWKAIVDEINKVNVRTDRVKKREEEFLSAKRHICAVRSRLVTEASKESEGEPEVLRRAKIFRKIMEWNPIVIRDGELIVGSQTKYVVGASPATELVSTITSEVVEAEKPTAVSDVTYAILSEEDRESLRQDVEYWKGRSAVDVVEKMVFQSLGEQLASDFRKYSEAGILAWGIDRTRGNVNTDNAKVLNLGFNGIIREIREQLENLDFFKDREAHEKHEFLSAGLICCQAVIAFATRYAKLARDMAKKEKDATRKAELTKIAEHCEWVPANPARTFHEALQSYWLVHLALNLEAAEYGETPGRIDQWLYPFYKKDIREGRITTHEAAELLGCFWVKLNEMTMVKSLLWQKLVMSTMNQHFTICGVDKDGLDATNELSVLILEVARQMKMPQPAVYIRWHRDINEEVLIKAAETNRDHGGGVPAYLNDPVTIPKFLEKGISLVHARDWCANGCVGPGLSHVAGMSFGASVVFAKPKMFELSLHNGLDPRTGKQVGPKTGDPRNFKSFEELYNAFIGQVEPPAKIAVKFAQIASLVLPKYVHFPFCSVLMDYCIKKGKAFYQGGGPYQLTGVLIIGSGVQNITDSMVTIKKLVFEEKKLSMAEILDALAVDFEGKEDLRQMLMSATCYGNDDDYADDIFNALSWDTGKIVIEQPCDFAGNPVMLMRGGATQHFWEGQFLGATPDGRKAYTPRADAIMSPAQGKDVKGPTAVILSATKSSQLEHSGASLHNMKIMPSVVKTREGIRKFLSLVKTYFERGGWHLQVNMMGQEILREAQKHPEQYRSLVVRVGGFSAYFVELSEGVQNDIIARTEHEL
jgi:formate C-acetyltransferase